MNFNCVMKILPNAYNTLSTVFYIRFICHYHNTLWCVGMFGAPFLTELILVRRRGKFIIYANLDFPELQAHQTQDNNFYFNAYTWETTTCTLSHNLTSWLILGNSHKQWHHIHTTLPMGVLTVLYSYTGSKAVSRWSLKFWRPSCPTTSPRHRQHQAFSVYDTSLLFGHQMSGCDWGIMVGREISILRF